MKRFLNIFSVLAIGLMLSLAGCGDKNAVVDQNTEVVNNNWGYTNKIVVPVKIEDAAAAYRLCLNLRVTADYKYSNLFVLIHQTGPDKKTTTTRYEFKLANADGEWLGDGSGNIYSFQIPFRNNYKFPTNGIYEFDIEQNMRDNPLHEVSDVGMRVEKIAP